MFEAVIHLMNYLYICVYRLFVVCLNLHLAFASYLNDFWFEWRKLNSNLSAGIFGQQSLKHGGKQTAQARQRSMYPGVDLLLCILRSACVTIYLNKGLVKLIDSFQVLPAAVSVSTGVFILHVFDFRQGHLKAAFCVCVFVSQSIVSRDWGCFFCLHEECHWSIIRLYKLSRSKQTHRHKQKNTTL